MQWYGVRVLLYNLAVFYHLCLTLWHWYFIKGGRDRNCLYSPRILLPPKYFNWSFNFNYCLFKQVGFNSIAKFLIQVDNRYDWKWTIMVNIQIKLNLIGFKSQIPQTYSHSNTHFTERSLNISEDFSLDAGNSSLCSIALGCWPRAKEHTELFPAPRESTPVLWSIDCYGLYYTNMVCIVITFGELLYSIVTNEHRRLASPQGQADQLFII